MAHIATKKYSYLAQAGILTGLTLIGLILGGLISSAIVAAKFGIGAVSSADAMQKMLVPENANIMRIVQLTGVFFLFLVPPFIYARICHRWPARHLGLTKKVDHIQLILAVVLIFSAIPLVGMLRELTLQLPLGEAINAKIISSKNEYMKQVSVLGRMNSTGEYVIALFIMAILPGLCEEVFFRGAVQNLFTRWFRNPVSSILFTAVIFSAFHFEYADFLGRFFLGIVLGWVFYLTGNLWLNVLMHAAFNGLSVTALYLSTRPGVKVDPNAVNETIPPLLAIIAGIVLIIVAYAFYRNNKKKGNRPGEEVVPVDYEDPDNPSWVQTGTQKTD